MRWIWVLALTGCAAQTDPRGDDTDTEDTDVEDTEPFTTGYVDVYPFDESSCRSPTRTGGIGSGEALSRVTLATGPEGPKCNDGTDPVVYIRPGSGDGVDDWVLYTQGGSSCNSHATCADRWCNQDPPYDASKMSSTWAPDGIRGDGIFHDGSVYDNTFADWNHVFVYYCSSDQWTGGNLEPNRLSDPEGQGPDVDVYFHGHRILEDVVDRLTTEGLTSDDGSRTLPALASADRVVLTGSSAGGGGMRHNADWIAGAIRDTSPEVDVRLVVDAGYGPAQERQLGSTDWEETTSGRAEAAAETWGSTLDESCLSTHPDAEWKCIDSTHVLLHHLDMPFFVREDLDDPVNGSSWTQPEFGNAVRQQLIALSVWPNLASTPAFDTDAEEHAGTTPVVPRGSFGPFHGTHEAIYLDGPFFEETVQADDTSYSFHDVVSAWMAGDTPVNVVEPAP